ncbi:MAG: hypothetical protein J7M14_03965, partial [Planctomycetes bacterium]|nr:hypothetical protein [Planctomycetota bacterium]
MKTTRIILPAVAVALVCALVMSRTFAGPDAVTSPAVGAVKVAVCDIRRIWSNSEHLGELHAKLNA